MEKILSYLHDIKYTTLNITSFINKNTYDKYVKTLMSKPNVVAYFKRNKSNNKLFKEVGAPKCYNYYFMNKDNYMFINITNNFYGNIKFCFFAFLKNGPKCGICLSTTKHITHCKRCYFGMCNDCKKGIMKEEPQCPKCKLKLNITKFDMDEMKEYISLKNYKYMNITPYVNEQNFKKINLKKSTNFFFVVMRDIHTEFIFTYYEKESKNMKQGNVLISCHGRAMTLIWKNKLEHVHKIKIDAIVGTSNCEMCLVNWSVRMNTCTNCKCIICDICIQKISPIDRNCPKCKICLLKYEIRLAPLIKS
jgi:hypothetical protein